MSEVQILIREFMLGLSLWQVFLLVALGFAAIYFGLASFTLLMTRRVLPALKIGRTIDMRPVGRSQMVREVRLSLVSILVFGAYGALTLFLHRLGRIEILWTYSPRRFALDMLLLTLWNEVHFYACHALLHRPWLYRKVHRLHHLSVVPTPFSTYSFHWFEAVMLSSVMILYLAVSPLSMGAIILFPVLSLFMNNIGHMNYAVFPALALNHLFSSCRRHTLHHTHIKGNYGFAFPWFDETLRTRSPRFDYDEPLEKAPRP
jgi:sterol desaturase/sphingolipid hydroxylase (fatty acid hydroxylase superfamily)